MKKLVTFLLVVLSRHEQFRRNCYGNPGGAGFLSPCHPLVSVPPMWSGRSSDWNRTLDRTCAMARSGSDAGPG